MNKLVPSFERNRGEQRTEKHVSEEVKMAPCFDTPSNLREDCFVRALALSPIALSFLITKRSGEKNNMSFTSCSRRTPEDAFACQKQKSNRQNFKKKSTGQKKSGNGDVSFIQTFSCSSTVSTTRQNNQTHEFMTRNALTVN